MPTSLRGQENESHFCPLTRLDRMRETDALAYNLMVEARVQKHPYFTGLLF
jgi:hypothetical protein